MIHKEAIKRHNSMFSLFLLFLQQAKIQRILPQPLRSLNYFTMWLSFTCLLSTNNDRGLDFLETLDLIEELCVLIETWSSGENSADLIRYVKVLSVLLFVLSDQYQNTSQIFLKFLNECFKISKKSILLLYV